MEDSRVGCSVRDKTSSGQARDWMISDYRWLSLGRFVLKDWCLWLDGLALGDENAGYPSFSSTS